MHKYVPKYDDIIYDSFDDDIRTFKKIIDQNMTLKTGHLQSDQKRKLWEKFIEKYGTITCWHNYFISIKKLK